MKKKIILLLVVLLLAGCTVVRIDTSSIDNIVSVVLSKKNKLYNRAGIGYKYYVPKGVTYIDSRGSNDRLYSDGVYYYLYLDEIGYYYKNKVNYKVDNSKFYSKKLNTKYGKGYLDITKKNNNYLVSFVYNYARIEANVPESELNKTILNASYILSTVKYNKDVVKLSLNDGDNNAKEEKYDKFTSKKETDDNFLKYDEKKD